MQLISQMRRPLLLSPETPNAIAIFTWHSIRPSLPFHPSPNSGIIFYWTEQNTWNLQISSGERHLWSKIGDAEVDCFLLECVDSTIKLKVTKRRPKSKAISKPYSGSWFALSQCWISWKSQTNDYHKYKFPKEHYNGNTVADEQ